MDHQSQDAAPAGAQPKGGADAPARPGLPGLRDLGPANRFADEVCSAMSRAAPFSALAPDDARRLCDFMSLHAAEAGATLFREGDPSDCVLLVVDGAVEVLRRNRNQFAARLALASVGQSVGEMSMFDGAPRFSSCVALEPTRLAVLTRAGLDALVAESPALGAALLMAWAALLSERLRDAGGRLFSQLEALRAA